MKKLVKVNWSLYDISLSILKDKTYFVINNNFNKVYLEKFRFITTASFSVSR